MAWSFANASLATYASRQSPTVPAPAEWSECPTVGSRTAVASALSRQLKAGPLKQPARRRYQVPVTHPLLGELHASPDEIAKALAGKNHLKLQPSGAYAANLLGLSDQVPELIVYLTDWRCSSPKAVRQAKIQWSASS